jgi:hypothetical protein
MVEFYRFFLWTKAILEPIITIMIDIQNIPRTIV